MRVVNKKIIVSVIILMVIGMSLLIYKNSSDKGTQLDRVKLKYEEKDNPNMFAIMLEQSDGTYKESTDSVWPEDMQYNKKLSGCIDANGNTLDNILSYDATNKIAKVKTTSASYCYLYFSIPKWCNEDETAAECLLRNPTTSLSNTSMEAGMYRYQGTDADNYVCFGTSSQSECLENTDKYLYRIIGIDANNQLKLIKNSSIGKYLWHNTDTDNTIWPNSDLFKSLNGLETDTITPIFIDNETYDYMETGSTWNNKIVTTSWKYGDTTSNGDYDGATMYAIENGWTDTINAKVSLIYIHDFYYAFGAGGTPTLANVAQSAWLYIGRCTGSATNEWTMVRYGLYGSKYYAWSVYTRGEVEMAYLTTAYDAVRPVFFLESTIQITDGTGLSTDPFMLN